MSGALVLDDLAAFVRRYVVLNEDQVVALALWVVHTHAVDALGITPYLAINSAEKQSGKTMLLETLELVVARPWLTGSVSAATLARKIEQQRPTLLLDESDAAFKGDREYAETLRGVLNSGFKASGTYSRCVGASGTALKVADFKTFCAKAIAGIGHLPDTVADRSIPIRLKRKTAGESVERWRQRRVAADALPLRERIVAWAEASEERLAALDLAPLEELGDRAADIWEPLLGIAYLAGETWFGRARRAAIALSGRDAVDDESTSVCLLADLREIFESAGVDRSPSATIVTALIEIEESPWAEWYGRPITAHGIAKILKRFEIRPRTIRVGEVTSKGYLREQFLDAWARYVDPEPSHPSSATVTTAQPAWSSQKDGNSNRNATVHVPGSEDGANPHGYGDVTSVTVTQGGSPSSEPDADAEAERIRAKFAIDFPGGRGS